MPTEITVSEALAQGYEYYVYHEDGFQSLKHISDGGIDFERGPCVVEKESSHPSGMDAKEIAETLADQIQCQYDDETGDDTNAAFDAIMAIDFTDVEQRIAEALSSVSYFKGTDIKLKP